MSDILSCGKCVLQDFLPCGDPDHFDAYPLAVRAALGQEVTEIYAGFKGDPRAKTWARYYAGSVLPLVLVEVAN